MKIHTLVIVNFRTRDIPLCRTYDSREVAEACAKEFLRGYVNSLGFESRHIVEQMIDGEFSSSHLEIQIVMGDV